MPHAYVTNFQKNKCKSKHIYYLIRKLWLNDSSFMSKGYKKLNKVNFYFLASKDKQSTPVLLIGEATEKQQYIITSTFTHFNNILIGLFFIYFSSNENQLLHSERFLTIIALFSMYLSRLLAKSDIQVEQWPTCIFCIKWK